VNKNASYVFILLALTLLIVPPVIDFVNATANNHAGSISMLFASGSPLPPPVPWATTSPQSA